MILQSLNTMSCIGRYEQILQEAFVLFISRVGGVIAFLRMYKCGHRAVGTSAARLQARPSRGIDSRPTNPSVVVSPTY